MREIKPHKNGPATAHLSTYGQGSSTDRITNKEEVVKANKSAPTNIPGVPGHKGLTYNLADLDKFVKRKIAKYNNNVSGKGSGSSELLQENLFNI